MKKSTPLISKRIGRIRTPKLAILALLTFLIFGSGSLIGQVILKDIETGPVITSNPLHFFQATPTTVIFLANQQGLGAELWKTDGTETGTMLLKDLDANFRSSLDGSVDFTRLDHRILFSAMEVGATVDHELYITDGTEAGTSLLVEINSIGSSKPGNFEKLDSLILFVADDGINGRELWRTNGTASGTFLLKDINPGDQTDDGFQASVFVELTQIGNLVYFAANDGVHGKELWRSDGTASGTYMVQDINPGAGDSDCGYFIGHNGKVLFSADDGTVGDELWETDPTNDNTQMVVDIYPGSISSRPTYPVAFDGKIYFRASGTNGGQLYRTDGTAAGTDYLTIDTLVAAKPKFFRKMGGHLYFAADTRAHGIELWRTDGTQAGTNLVKDINTEMSGRADGFVPSFSEALTNMIVVGDSLMYFPATAGSGSSSRLEDELWQTDGTAAGTWLVKDIWPGEEGSTPRNFFHMENGKVLFTADDGVNGLEPWIIDPSNSSVGIEKVRLNHTHLIHSISPNPFHDNVTVSFSVESVEEANLSVFDMKGREIYSSGLQSFAKGDYKMDWNAQGVPSGLYFCKLRIGNQVDTRTVVRK